MSAPPLNTRPELVSDVCFRLVALKIEEQNEVEVVKPVLQDREVMRMCCTLGMLSTVNPKDFQLGMLEAHEFDDDFARLLSQEVFSQCASGNGGSSSGGGVHVRSVFGKQTDVKQYLDRLGVWPSEVKEESDQGIYAVLLDNAYDSEDVQSSNSSEYSDGAEEESAPEELKLLVVFAWLSDGYFGRDHLRGTATYLLRCLTCLSPDLTCCVSKYDTGEMQRMVNSSASHDMEDWKSFSVEFAVEKQQDDKDGVKCTVMKTLSLPTNLTTNEPMIIKGSFPAVVTVKRAPASKTMMTTKAVFPTTTALIEHLKHKAEQFELTVDFGMDAVAESVLTEIRQLPEAALAAIDVDYNMRIDKLEQDLRATVHAKADHAYRQLLTVKEKLFSIGDEVAPGERQQAIAVVRGWLKRDIRVDPAVLRPIIEAVRMVELLPSSLHRSVPKLIDLFEAGDEVGFSSQLAAIDIAKMGKKKRQSLLASVLNMFGTQAEVKFKVPSDAFKTRMIVPLETLKTKWWSGVEAILHEYREHGWEGLRGNYLSELKNGRVAERRTLIDTALQAQLAEWSGLVEHELTYKAQIVKRKGRIHCEHTEEQWLPTSELAQVWKLATPGATSEPVHSGLDSVMHLGEMRLDKGHSVLGMFSIQRNSVLVVTLAAEGTYVSRSDFRSKDSSRSRSVMKRIQRFGGKSLLCDFDAVERLLAFVDESGKVCLYWFDNAFTHMEIAGQIDLDATTTLDLPISSLLVSDGVVNLVDHNGRAQSVTVCTRQTSPKFELVQSQTHDISWTSSPFSLLGGDALCVFTSYQKSNSGDAGVNIHVIATEDQRLLSPYADQAEVIALGTADHVSVQAFGDDLYVLDPILGQVYVLSVAVTMKSDSYRIRKAMDGSTGNDSYSEGNDTQHENSMLSAHWLWAIFHLYEKFPVRDLLSSTASNALPSLPQLHVRCDVGAEMEEDANQTVRTFVGAIMENLETLNKPLFGMDLVKTLRVTCGGGSGSIEVEDPAYALTTYQSVPAFLTLLVTFVPVHICRAEHNALTIMSDGQDLGEQVLTEPNQQNVQSADIARSIRFGLLSPLLQSWKGRCIVITSMGKQSTGKSYFLNHLAGTSFAIAGARCTDGAWMCARVLSNGVLLVVIDFEGLGSFERTEQEDVFLSVLNASMSILTVFRMEMRFDKEIDELFSKFQKGSQLLKRDAQLFRGKLYMSVKDVNPNDQRGVVREFQTKFAKQLEVNKDQNFLTDMYGGRLEVNCSPPLGTKGYYRSLARVQEIIERHLCGDSGAGFSSGKEFLDCIRLVLAKISILDWTSLDDSAFKFKLAELSDQLPGIARYGGVPLDLNRAHKLESTVAAREELVNPMTGDVIDVTLEEVGAMYPTLAMKWSELRVSVPFDTIKDDTLDLGTVLVDSESSRLAAVCDSMRYLFRRFVAFVGNESRVHTTVETQKQFDTFLLFLLRRRRVRIHKWVYAQFGGRIPDEWGPIEQSVVAPLQTMFVRCLDRCSHCLLGCMNAAAHSSELQDAHDCGTNHLCSGVCVYCKKDSSRCSRPSGHADACECAEGDHSCGAACSLQGAKNCGERCCAKIGHDGEHRCSIAVHICGHLCDAVKCSGHCQSDLLSHHEIHACNTADGCLSTCEMPGCDRICSSEDHFHGLQVAPSTRTTADSDASSNNVDGKSKPACTSTVSPVLHLCSDKHSCPDICSADGICGVKTVGYPAPALFAGSRGSFEYTKQEMHAVRKKCSVSVPAGETSHTGPHSCLRSPGEGSNRVFHLCDVQCPCCLYYCEKSYGHMDPHRTTHGNMRNTKFIADEGTSEIDLFERKYEVGESGVAEMCYLFCSKMGRGHVHYLECGHGSDKQCPYRDQTMDDDANVRGRSLRRRHRMHPLTPAPDQNIDELLHDCYWKQLNWVDPSIGHSASEVRDSFQMCAFKCNAPEHDAAHPSFCVLPAWHSKQDKLMDAGDGLHSFVGGHKFKCSHAAPGRLAHHVFVLDCSGSMRGKPWESLMKALQSYLSNRVNSGARNDLVTVITFGGEATIEYEALKITSALSQEFPFRGGETWFSLGLRSANEVLSRIGFGIYTPVLLFFSDGRPHDPKRVNSLAEHLGQRYRKYGLVAFTVGMGKNINFGYLKLVASMLDGKYRHAVNGSELKTVFYSISASLGSKAALMALPTGCDD